MTLTTKLELTVSVSIDYEPTSPTSLEITAIWLGEGDRRVDIQNALDQETIDAIIEHCEEDWAAHEDEYAVEQAAARADLDDDPDWDT